MKVNIKEGFKNQFITILYMIKFNIISFFIFCASYIGTKPTGNLTGTGLLPLSEYKANLYIVIIFWILFLLVFNIFYKKYLKKYLKEQIKIHWSFTIAFFIVMIIFIVVESILSILAGEIVIGLFSSVSNYPNELYIIGLMILCILIDFMQDRKK